MLQWLVVVLAVLAVANLALVLVGRSQFSDFATKQADSINLLTRRMDSSDERYAQLRGQFQVTSEKLGLTQQELSRAHELAQQVQQQQQTAVKPVEPGHRPEGQRPGRQQASGRFQRKNWRTYHGSGGHKAGSGQHQDRVH